MKNTFIIRTALISILFISANSPAKSGDLNLNFECKTQLPTTSFYLRTEKSEVILTTVHHNGVAYMPIHEGIVVPHDLSYLKDVSSLLTDMGSKNEFRFPLSRCQVDGPGQMSCSGGNTQNFNGHEMRGFFLYTSKLKESAFGKSFDKIKVTLSVQIMNFAPVQDIVMNYEPNECQMSF